MDLYGDLPAAVGATVALDAEDKSKTSTVWANGVVGFTPASAPANAPKANTRATMLLAALSGARHKSPDAAALKGARGISLAFRPASIRKPTPSSTTAFQAQQSSGSSTNTGAIAPPTESVEDSAQRGGLGFVAATTWTKVVTTGKENQPTSSTSDPTSEQNSAAGGQFFQATYRDEYHPSRPNSYEAYCDERAAKEKLEQVKRDLDRRNKEQEREAIRERAQVVKDLSEGKAPSMAISAGRGRGMTVPAWMKKKIEETSTNSASLPAPQRVAIDTSSDQFEDAQPRSGLGFQSIETVTTRVSSSSSRDTRHQPLRDEFGRDISNRAVEGSSGSQSDRSRRLDRGSSQRRSRSRSQDGHWDRRGHDDRRTRGASPLAQPRADSRSEPVRGRVVLLQNMVGPGEVDDELQEEVKEECSSKYGPVSKCIVHELRGRVHPEEAVRIFVEFVQASSAAQAVQGLNSRFFGGRRVKAALYDDAKFARLDLTG